MAIFSTIILAAVAATGVLGAVNPKTHPDTQVRDSFNEKFTYAIERPFEQTINTFEAWIKLPSNIKNNEKGGVILGNFYNTSYGYPGACDYLIDKNGNFRLYYNRLTGITPEIDYIFKGYDFRTNEWEHIALTRNNNGFKFYVNGNLIESITKTTSDAISTMRYQIGCDWRNWSVGIDNDNARLPFRGQISSVAVYNKELTQAEIKEDMSKEHLDATPSLMGAWLLNDWSEEVVYDDSLNDNNALSYTFEKFVDVEEEDEFDYSILCIPDMQIMTRYNPSRLNAEFNHLLDIAGRDNIQYMSFVGDLTDTCDVISGKITSGLPQWNTVRRNFDKLDENDISYGFVPGNHDYDDGAGRIRSATYYNQFLPFDQYSQKEYFGGAYYYGDMTNYYNVKKINGIEYVFIHLEFGPRESVLKWASRVVDAYPNARIIYSTHSYIEPDGRIAEPKDPYAATRYGIDGCVNGIDMFNKLVKKHANSFMVFSGHNSSDDIVYRTDIGDHGNTIHSFLIDVQGTFDSDACDVYAKFKFNEGEKKIYTYWYSNANKAYLNKQNQFVIDFADAFNPAVDAQQSKVNPVTPNKSNNIGLYIGLATMLVVLPVGTIGIVKAVKGGKKNEQ